MAARDRRSGNEHRDTNRYPITLDIEWEGSGGRQPGSISDISLDGCFVLSSGDVSDEDHVNVFIPLADGMKVQFGGKVANHVFEIGFGVHFEQLSAGQRDLLIKILKDQEGR